MTRRDDDPFDDIFDVLDDLLGDDGFDTIEPSDRQAEPEIHTDTHEYDDKLVFIADLPGVDKEDITIRSDGHEVILKIDTPAMRGDGTFRFSLPEKVDPNSATASFRNGVLKTTYEKTDSNDIDLN